MTFLRTKASPELVKSGYLLNVVDDSQNASKRIKVSMPTAFSGKVKKTLAILAIAAMGIMGVGSGLFMISSPAETKQAQAFDLFDINTWFCATKDSSSAYLGGENGIIKDGFSGKVSAPAGGGFLDVPKETGPKTALEMFGYYSPTYNTWVGMYPGDTSVKDYTYLGTGGVNQLTKYGKSITITNPSLSSFYSHDVGSCMNFGGSINTGLANGISYIPKLMVAVSGEVYSWATTTTLTDKNSALYPVAKGVETLIIGSPGQKGLKDLLFLDFLTPIVLISTFWLIWHGLIKRSSMQAAQGAIWMILASIGALLFLSAPLKVAEGIDNVVGGVNSAIVGAINETGNTGDYCALPDGAVNKDTRTIKCSIWYSMIYSPWVNGQFGYNQYQLNTDKYQAAWDDTMQGDNIDTGSTDLEDGKGWQEVRDSGEVITIGRVGDSRGVLTLDHFGDYQLQNTNAMLNWPYYQMYVSSGYTKYAGINYSEIAFNQLVVNNNPVWKDASGAIGSSFTSLLATILPTVVMLSLALTLLSYQLMMLLLIAFSPLFFLIGVAPGFGRRIAMRWIELVLGLLIKRIIIVLFLAIYLRLLMTILGVADMNWLFQMVLVGILSIIALTQRNKFIDIFTDVIDLGGDKRISGDGRLSAMAGGAARNAYSKTSGVVRRGVVAGSTVGREGMQKTGSAVASRVLSGKDVNARGLGKDAKLGIDVGATGKGGRRVAANAQNPLSSHSNILTPADINAGRLNKRELTKITDDKGVMDQKKAQKWIDKTKVKQMSEQKAINNEYKANQESREAIRKHEKNPFEKAKALDANRLEREALRKRTASNNKEIRRIFGNESLQTGTKAPLATRYKGTSKRYRS